MIDVVIWNANNPKKKYEAVFNSHTIIPFGAAGYEDFTTHRDEQRRKNYIKRHGGEDWTRGNIMSPARLSRYILWEKPTLREAVKHANDMYKDVRFYLKSKSISILV